MEKASENTKETPDFSPDCLVCYKTAAEGELKLHVFHAEPGEKVKPVPCIVFFFGGGFVGGKPAQFYPHCRYLVSRGITAIAAEYRIQSVHGTTPFESVSDGKSAIRWIRQHAVELGVDPARIAAGGGSAGGHIAASTGILKSYDDPSEDLSVSSRPNALVLFNPVIDNGPESYGYDRIKERYVDFSPIHNIEKGVPPAIVFLGDSDRLIPVATMGRFKKRIEEVGSRCDVWIYENQPHGFFNYREGNNPCYYSTVYEADRFLSSIGYLQGNPSLEKGPASCHSL